MMNSKLLLLFVVTENTYFDFTFNSTEQNNNPSIVVFLDHLSSTHSVM